jgi:hypothetical protein
MGSRQFVYGGMKMLASNKALTAPSLADFLIGIAPLCSGEYHVSCRNQAISLRTR